MSIDSTSIRRIRNLLPILALAILLLPGCGGIPRQWSNFNAFFNTYYNARTSFDAGVEKNQTQEILFVEGRPIRIYPSPGQAGREEFKNASDKGADILRHHERSDFLDPALFLIGRSYFFRTEYFSALQTFEELRTVSSDPKLRQLSVFWTSRTLYEMGQHQQAIQFTEDEYLSQEDWDPEIEAEVALILAEHHIREGSEETAIRLLDPALPQIEDGDARVRGYFLLGQLLLAQGDHASASVAFNRVARSKDDYELIFQSRKNLAIALRESGDLKGSEEIFRRLIRDDKNIESRNQLRFERARTLQEDGRTEEALKDYLDLLRDPKIAQERLTQSRAYYEIAEIQRAGIGDYRLAAIYYDSAAGIRLSEEEMPPGYDARDKAASFGEYADLRAEIDRLDSLMALGRMSEQARDSLVASLRETRLAAYMERMERERQQQNTIVLVDRDGGGPGGPGEQQGFLNHLSEEKLADARLQFRALWGERPLVDNWRRAEAVAQAPASMVSEGVPADGMPQGPSSAGSGVGSRPSGRDAGMGRAGMGPADGSDGSVVSDAQLGIDLSDIPIDSSSQLDMLDLIHERMYRMANVFYFSIDQADSALALYSSIAEHTRIDRLKGQSLYLLADHAMALEDTASAAAHARQVVRLMPESIYAHRLSERFGLVIPPKDTLIVHADAAAGMQTINGAIMDADVGMDAAEQDAAASETGTSDPAMEGNAADRASIELAPRQILALLDGGAVPGFAADMSDSTRAELLMMGSRADGVSVDVASLMAAEALRILLRAARDAVGPLFGGSEPESGAFLFDGPGWDGIRSVLDEYLTRFPDGPDASWITRLKTDLTRPVTPTQDQQASPDPASSDATEDLPIDGGPAGDPRI